MKTSVYLVRALPNDDDDFPNDIESVHRTRDGAEKARLEAIAESNEGLDEGETSGRDYEVVRFELFE